jgi:RNA polymerase sigma-70 factor (ECF subfamily)
VTFNLALYPPTAPRPCLRDTSGDQHMERTRGEAHGREPSSFGVQLSAQVDALHKFACYLSRDTVLAEDLVQEAFARALSAETRFVVGSNLKAWLFRILHNVFLDVVRRKRKSPVELRELSDDDDTDDDDTDCSRDVWLRGDIEIDRLRRLVVNDVESALARLSVNARSVVLLDLEGFTEAEIAKVMDTPVGTVKSRLARARAALRERLLEYAT